MVKAYGSWVGEEARRIDYPRLWGWILAVLFSFFMWGTIFLLIALAWPPRQHTDDPMALSGKAPAVQYLPQGG